MNPLEQFEQELSQTLAVLSKLKLSAMPTLVEQLKVLDKQVSDVISQIEQDEYKARLQTAKAQINQVIDKYKEK